jgi:hypothetical protein
MSRGTPIVDATDTATSGMDLQRNERHEEYLSACDEANELTNQGI